MIYAAKFEDVVYVLHAFQKKTKKTSQEDIALAKRRYRQIGAGIPGTQYSIHGYLVLCPRNSSENEWQSFRTKKERSLELTSVFHPCQPGRRKIAVKVVDIFGNDTMTILDMNI